MIDHNDCKARLIVARKALKSTLTIQKALSDISVSDYSKGLVAGIEMGLQQIDLILGDLAEEEES